MSRQTLTRLALVVSSVLLLGSVVVLSVLLYDDGASEARRSAVAPPMPPPPIEERQDGRAGSPTPAPAGPSVATPPPSSAGEEFSFHPVAGAFEPDDTKLEDCSDSACFEQAFGNVVYYEGPKEGFRLFDARLREDPKVESGCHRIAHIMGSAALSRYEGDVSKAFAEGSSSCWSGYYHGLLERSLADVRSEDALVETARSICSDPGIQRDTFVYYQCVHGLGHGLMILTGYQLPFSLSVCEKLNTAWEQTSCDGGVFMENFNSSYGVKSAFLKDDDPVYPCPTVAERHKLYCYLQVTDRMGQLGLDYSEMAKTCSQVEKDWRGTCFQSLGRTLSGTIRNDVVALSSACDVARPVNGLHDCVFGVVRDVVSNDAGGERASRLCRLVAAEAKLPCYAGMGTILRDLRSGDRAAFEADCRRLAGDYFSACAGRREG